MQLDMTVKPHEQLEIQEYLGMEMVAKCKEINGKDTYRVFASVGIGAFRGYAETTEDYYSEKNFEHDKTLRERLIKEARVDLQQRMRTHFALIQPYITLTIKEAS